MREMKELSIWNETWAGVFDHYLEGGLGIGIACDVARFLIQHDQGGIYLDLDIISTKWSNDLHHYFDFFVWVEHKFDERVIIL